MSSYTHSGITTHSFTPVVCYRYEVNGREQEGRAIDQSPLNVSFSEREKAEAIVSRYLMRSTHPVHYNPKDSTQTMLEPGMSWSESGLFVMVPLVALGLALLTFVSLRAEKGELSAT